MSSVGFRWLDILEKEFDKAFVDLDLTLGEIDLDEPNVVFNVRQKLCTLGSCFAQLTHKAQTIFQNSAKIEAELIHMRSELVESKAQKEVLEIELHNLLLQLHSSQLSQLPDTLGNKKLDLHFRPDVTAIKKRLDAEIKQSPMRLSRTGKDNKETDDIKLSSPAMETSKCKIENVQLLAENSALRNEVLALTGEVYGAKLAAKYLDKELAGRIQQLQLLGREMRGDVRDKLWRQLESEILLQRHKTVVRACRRNSSLNNPEKCSKPDSEVVNGNSEHFGDIRSVIVKRKPDQGLGISITGGREHGVPILISELEPKGPAASSEQLYIGDAILFVNDIDLRNVCHKEAVSILQNQTGDCVLQVQYIAADDSDNSLEEDGLSFRFFDDEVCDSSNSNVAGGSQEIMNTPTAPRTPESNPLSRLSCNSPDSKKLLNLLEIAPSNTDNGNDEFNNTKPQPNGTIELTNNNNTPKTTKYTDNLSNVDTNDLILLDNATNNIIKLEDFKKVDILSNIDNNYNFSTNSLNSENLSSPMQTSTDIYLDSELLSTDITSNDSQSPKNLQIEVAKKNTFTYNNTQAEKLNKSPSSNTKIYASNDSLCNLKSDQSLLDSAESCGSSPVHKQTREYKKPKKHKKKYFGVKTLQSIFNKTEGYSDISSTASEPADDIPPPKPNLKSPEICNTNENIGKNVSYTETTPHFEENVHSILSDIFLKSHIESTSSQSFKTMGTKKYFPLHGHNLRVGKALRLCPNEDLNDAVENDQRKEKLLARYVYNANSVNADGVGDPDFGTPV